MIIASVFACTSLSASAKSLLLHIAPALAARLNLSLWVQSLKFLCDVAIIAFSRCQQVARMMCCLRFRSMLQAPVHLYNLAIKLVRSSLFA